MTELFPPPNGFDSDEVPTVKTLSQKVTQQTFQSVDLLNNESFCLTNNQ